MRVDERVVNADVGVTTDQNECVCLQTLRRICSSVPKKHEHRRPARCPRGSALDVDHDQNQISLDQAMSGHGADRAGVRRDCVRSLFESAYSTSLPCLHRQSLSRLGDARVRRPYPRAVMVDRPQPRSLAVLGLPRYMTVPSQPSQAMRPSPKTAPTSSSDLLPLNHRSPFWESRFISDDRSRAKPPISKLRDQITLSKRLLAQLLALRAWRCLM
jgi:hypothetical protein